MNMRVGHIAIWITTRYVLPFVEVEEHDAIKWMDLFW
jgi:hypothetical protein